MKKLFLKTILVLVIGLAFSCGNKSKEKENLKQTEKSEKSEENHRSNNSGLVLDDGKLWIANPETTTGVENMINIMKSFTEKDDVQAYVKLTESLKSEFSMIFEKCTMTGEAHNQLHNFLVPIKDSFKTLSSTDLEQCQNSFDKLNKHLNNYKKFFK